MAHALRSGQAGPRLAKGCCCLKECCQSQLSEAACTQPDAILPLAHCSSAAGTARCWKEFAVAGNGTRWEHPLSSGSDTQQQGDSPQQLAKYTTAGHARSGPPPLQQACSPEPSSSSSAFGRASATAGCLVIEGALGMVSVQWCLCLHSYHLHDCWPDGLSWLDAGSSSFHKAMIEAGKVSRCSRCPCV